ncbi:MAG: hypothetical protein WC686_04765 [Candidatus Shapirobacteria bacterium]|jgi:hypothetical protein
MNELNLLPSRARFQQRKIQLKKKSMLFVTGLVAVLVLSLLVTGILWGMANFKLTAEDKKYKKTLTDYQAMADNIATSQDLKYRAKVIGKILNERFEYGSYIKKIDSFLIENAAIDDYKLIGLNKIQLNGSANGDYIDAVEKKVGEINAGKLEGFGSARIIGLVADNGLWRFTLEVGTNEK